MFQYDASREVVVGESRAHRQSTLVRAPIGTAVLKLHHGLKNIVLQPDVDDAPSGRSAVLYAGGFEPGCQVRESGDWHQSQIEGACVSPTVGAARRPLIVTTVVSMPSPRTGNRAPLARRFMAIGCALNVLSKAPICVGARHPDGPSDPTLFRR